MPRKTLALAAVILAALACGPAAAPPEQPADAAPQAGGTLSVHLTEEPTDWDLTYNGKGAGHGYQLAYEGLLRFSAGPEVEYNKLVLQPGLAERWEISPDAKAYTFHVRQGVRFAGMPPVNGRSLTPDDVKWTYEYVTRTGQFADRKLPSGQLDWMFEGLERVEVTGPSTVVVHFKRPFVPFLSYAAADINPIMPKEIFVEEGHLKNRIVGTGPWQFDAANSQKGNRLVWKRNPSHWREGRPYLDEVRVLILPSDATALAAFRAKQLDWLGYEVLNPQAVKDLTQSQPGVQFKQYIDSGGFHIWWNLTRPPLSDARIRRAVNLAIDRDELSQTEFGVKSSWALAGACCGLFTDQEAREILKYDPAEATRLIIEAGYPNGLALEWDFPGNRYGDSYISRIQLIQAQLKKASINVTLKNVDPTEHSQNRRAGNYTMNLTSQGCGERLDYDSTIFSCYHGSSKTNYAGLNDPELNGLLEAQRAEIDPEKRRELVRTAVRLISEKTFGVDLFYAPRWEAWQPYVHAYGPNVGRSARYAFENTWISK